MLGLSNVTTTYNNNDNNNNNVATTTATALVPLLTSRLLEPSGNQNMEISLSLDPSSAVRLVQISVEASAGGLGAFVATLRLLAPMIVARKFLTSIGYICYDYYNGRYLRTTYKKRIQDFHFYEIPSALRAAGRSGLQLVGMALTGKVFCLGLNKAPCWMPTTLCQYWYGMVWLGAVLAAGRATEVWVSSVFGALWYIILQYIILYYIDLGLSSRVLSRTAFWFGFGSLCTHCAVLCCRWQRLIFPWRFVPSTPAEVIPLLASSRDLGICCNG